MQPHTLEEESILLKVKEKVTKILLMSNGSTTRLLEAIVGKTMRVSVLSQRVSSNIYDFDEWIDCSQKYLERKVSLHSNGFVFSDNIVIGAFDKFSEDIQEGLLSGIIPLGKLISDQESKRELIWLGTMNKHELEAQFSERKYSLKDYPARKYRIYVNGRCWFCILEIFHIDNIVNAAWT